MLLQRPLSVLTLALAAATALPLALPPAAQAQPAAATQAGDLVRNFEVTPLARLRPGEVLEFRLDAPPGAQVTLEIDGATASLRLDETRPGHYSGDYTIRQRDRLSATSRVTARVARQGQLDTATLGQSLLAGARPPAAAQPVAGCLHCGTVQSVRLVTVKDDHQNVIGTVAGGVLGGVLGHQVGGGSGRDLATIAGAVGGAYAGNRIENNMHKRQVHRVSVKLDDGTVRSVDYAENPGLQAGARVKVVNNTLERL